MKNQILKTSIVVTAKDQVWCELAGEAVILHLTSGVYYGLSPVGARVWSLLQAPRLVSEVLAMILEEYEVEPDRCESDLFVLLQELAAGELIEIQVETNGTAQ